MNGSIPQDTLHIWEVRACGLHPRAPRVLSAQEQARADGFRSAELAGRWRYFHTALREILSTYVGIAPAELVFTCEAGGKPALPGVSGLHFNLSHAGDVALVAVTDSHQVGVDIELCRDLDDMSALVRRNFSKLEAEQFGAVPHCRRVETFFDIWTRKEAIVKADGAGLAVPLDAFDVPVGTLGHWSSTTLRTEAARSYFLQALAGPPGYRAAVAVAAGNLSINGVLSPRYVNYGIEMAAADRALMGCLHPAIGSAHLAAGGLTPPAATAS